MNIRPYEPPDWTAVWEILEPVFRSGETYAYPPTMSADEARAAWTEGNEDVYVAENQTAAQMCEHSQVIARSRGYRAVQINLVVASNTGAVRLWKWLGFAVVGTLPGAFRHPRDGYVDAHVMYKELS